MWHCLEDKIRKARKVHRCCLCGRAIDKGASYVNLKGVSEDGFVAMKMHTECERLTRDWTDQEWEEPISESEFRAELKGGGE